MPIHASFPVFERHAAKPHPISRDLEKMYMGGVEWHERLQSFLQLLSRFSTSPVRITTRVKIMISFERGVEGLQTSVVRKTG